MHTDVNEEYPDFEDLGEDKKAALEDDLWFMKIHICNNNKNNVNRK